MSTSAGGREGLAPADRALLMAALQERGLRLTVQRQAVAEAVFNCEGHICADHILGSVAPHRPALRMNKTTVYRNLDLLLDLGLVMEHKCGDGRAQYEPASRGRHSHLMCYRCGQLLDMDAGAARVLSQDVMKRHSFDLDLESYPIFGLCHACRAAG